MECICAINPVIQSKPHQIVAPLHVTLYSVVPEDYPCVLHTCLQAECTILLAAQYIPGERMHRGMFRNMHIRPDNCPRSKLQKKWIEKINKVLTPEEEAGTLLHETKRLNKLKEQLEKSGIHLDCQVSAIIQNSFSQEISFILYMIFWNEDC